MNPIENPASDPDDDRLFELYKIAIDEYRFQVQFNWDRSKGYLLLCIALISSGVGLVNIGAADQPKILPMFLFGMGAFVAGIAANATRKGHKYYRIQFAKKTVLADELCLLRRIPGRDKDTDYDVAGFADADKKRRILADPEAYVSRPLSQETITSGLVLVFGLFSVLNLIGIAILLWRC